jgi:hypothetical protein
MLLRIEDHSLVGELCDHYRRSGFQAEPVGGGMVEVGLLEPLSAEDERQRVLAHFHVWAILHPEDPGELAD